jgi:hypothetical protein
VKVLRRAQRTEKYTVDPHIIDLREINQLLCSPAVCFEYLNGHITISIH